MAEASIPVDLFNPGQVFACMGFLEAAEVLAGGAEGGFDWSNEGDIRFRLRASADDNRFGDVLDFLATAEIRRYAPTGYADQPAKKNTPPAADDSENGASGSDAPDPSVFPGPTADRMALPIQIHGHRAGRAIHIDVGHWADTSSRNGFKLYAGNRSAASIARAMLFGTREKPKKGRSQSDLLTLGLGALWSKHGSDLAKDPFGIVTPMGGSFNFDPRGAWTGIDAGYSPDQQGHGVEASPVVEILAAIGLEHARPDEYETRRVRYGVWGALLPAMLARAALGGMRVGVPLRTFRFELGGTKHNKVVTFAQEETQL
jgi:CRISPR-associated protein Csx14